TQQQALKPKPPLLLLQPNKSLFEKRPSERSDGLFLSSLTKSKNYFLLITITYIISYIKPNQLL
ncbi:hypothetical protein ACTHTV_21820, partial [Neisseria sp. P0015.S010]